MKTIIIKLFVVLCCSEYSDGNYYYETKSLNDKPITYAVYSTLKYNIGDTIQYKLK